MSFFEKIKLSFYNLTHRKKTTAQCVVMMSFIMTLVFIASFFIATLTLQLNDSLDNYASRNYIDIKHYGDWLDDETIVYDDDLLNQDEQVNLKAKFNSVGDINYYKYPYFPSGNPIFCNWIVDGVVYESKLNNGDMDSNENYFDWWEIVCKEVSVPTFSKNMFTEFSKKFPGEKLIKYGHDIENDNEVLIPEEYLAFFEITPEQLLNTTVTIETVFYNAKIAGITNGNISMMYPDKDGNRDPFEEINIFTGTGVLFYTNRLEEVPPEDSFKHANKIFQRIELKTSDDIEKTIEYLENFLGDNYSVNYRNQSKLNELKTTHKILTFVWDIIVVLFLVLGFGFAIFLYSVMEHSAKQKCAYYGMMRAMGQNGTLGITVIETAIMTVFAAVICLIISSITVFLMNGAIIYISWSSYKFSLSAGLFALVFFINLIVIFSFNIFIVFLSSKRQNLKNISAALKS